MNEREKRYINDTYAFIFWLDISLLTLALSLLSFSSCNLSNTFFTTLIHLDNEGKILQGYVLMFPQ